MNKEDELEKLIFYLETTSLEPHDDYTTEFTYKEQKMLYKYITKLVNDKTKLQNNWNELNRWTESCINELKENDVYDRTSYEQGQIIALESFIAKMQELESDK